MELIESVAWVTVGFVPTLLTLVSLSRRIEIASKVKRESKIDLGKMALKEAGPI